MIEVVSEARKLKAICDARGYRVAVAESATVGYLQAAIASASGASTFFAGGMTAYSLEQKVRFLGIDAQHASDVDCVSERVAREMAIGIAELFHVNVGLATTGYAEADAVNGIAQPFIYYSIWCDGPGGASGADSHTARVESTSPDRVESQVWFARQVLRALTDFLAHLE